MTTTRAWRVLIVDDNALDRAEIRRLMLRGSDRRYVFTEAETVECAVTAVRDAPDGAPDLAIVDYHMPDGNAADFLTRLTRPGGGVACAVVVMTGGDAPDLGRKVLRAGAQDFIGKSWTTAESLARTVENAVERWAMTSELRESEARLARAQRAAHVGTWDWNLATDELYWTAEAWSLFCGAPGEGPVSSASWSSAFHPEDRAAADAEARLARGSGIYRCELRVRHADGRIVWLESIGEGAFGASGAPSRILGTVRDVTSRRDAESALRLALDAAERVVGERDRIVSVISHDLRSPLNNLLLSISVLDGHVADPVRTLPGKMHRQAQRMAKMLDELLDASQLRAGRSLDLDRREVDLVRLTRDAAEELQRAVPAHPIEVTSAVPFLMGHFDAMRLERVLGNLLSNAVKYSPAGGAVRVTIEGAQADGAAWAVLRVADDGIGVAAEDLATIFDWFGRGANARQKAIAGTGIGLAGARTIVEQHGGTIVVESELQRGATFTVKLPLVPPS